MTEFGRPHQHLRLTDSTNERARRLAEAGAPGGTVVTAGEQNAGRGRRGRAWSAPPGKALLYSAIQRPLELERSLLPLAVPVAVCEAIESLAPVSCAIKWPNDIWICEPQSKPVLVGRKIAGVLIEARPPEWAVIGIGVNVAIADGEFPGNLRWPATSIGHGVSVESTRDAVSAALGDWVEAGEATVLEAFRARDALAGREIDWQGAGVRPGPGTAAGIDDRGNLLVDLATSDRIALGSGEITLAIRP